MCRGLEDIRWEDKEKLLQIFGVSSPTSRKRKRDEEEDDERESEGQESEPKDNPEEVDLSVTASLVAIL